jgi:hypothetical protein
VLVVDDPEAGTQLYEDQNGHSIMRKTTTGFDSTREIWYGLVILPSGRESQ